MYGHFLQMSNPSESNFVEINGFPIHYDKFGTGSQVVLLIPGALGNFLKLLKL